MVPEREKLVAEAAFGFYNSKDNDIPKSQTCLA
jgi:hypothetical protein